MSRLSRFLTVFVILAGVYILLLRPAYQPPPLAPLTERIDHILIEKADRRLTVYRNGKALRTYDIALGFTPMGDKEIEGDGKTPEGHFNINRRNPDSAYHLSLGINYPQAQDTAHARAIGKSPGGDIFIHGQPNSLPDAITLPGDWTAGCVAVSNAEIEELWQITPNGTPVEIRP
ncbi:L,D-transpeptidase family protein [Shimia sediminis]|uniref:L,D-transpeptidase family protein n=1 Tax=Shimia sediminis TaxID=2497945 RepID=UPI000F8E6DEF|nr:L,D-transpeptidase family protein [Shimia sediminis]